MKREEDLEACRELLSDESIDHLHIRKKAIVTGFTDNLITELDGYRIVTVDISEWEYDELMETLRYELQKELSLLKYWVSRAKSLGVSLPIIGGGGSGGVESRPNYSRTTDYLNQVSNKVHEPLVVFIRYHGTERIEDFGWIAKLDLPPDATIVTDGFNECTLERSVEIEVGRLSKEQTIEYLSVLGANLSREEAIEVHRIHDGNPVAIEMAYKQSDLKSRLTGDSLRKLWERVYADKISGPELDLLTDSSHLIDLDQRDVATVTDKTRGEAKDLLQQLENKGIVSQEQSGLFTTDKYVKRYTASRLRGEELAEQHRMSFHDYAEKWAEGHESRMNKLQEKDESDGDGEPLGNLNPYEEMADPNLFLAVHHLSNIQDNIDRETFVEELDGVEADTSVLFAFGLISQRFFFEDPTDVIQDLADSILGIEEDVENELFSGTMGVLLDFDIQQFVSELSAGWSGEITTKEFDTDKASQPDEVVKRIQQGFESDFFEDLPNDVKLALSHIIALAMTDSRTAREYYNRFGKTATNYGLEEEPFCNWLEEVEKLAEVLSPDLEEYETDKSPTPHEESLEGINSEIRDRIDLKSYLEENQSQAQQRFQQRIENIRNRPEEIADQYMECGEVLSETENNLFPFMWYAVGHEMFTKIVLGGKNWEIFGEYQRWRGARDEKEQNLDDDEIVMSRKEFEKLLS